MQKASFSRGGVLNSLSACFQQVGVCRRADRPGRCRSHWHPLPVLLGAPDQGCQTLVAAVSADWAGAGIGRQAGRRYVVWEIMIFLLKSVDFTLKIVDFLWTFLIWWYKWTGSGTEYEFLQHPGEVFFFCPGWWHSTYVEGEFCTTNDESFARNDRFCT